MIKFDIQMFGGRGARSSTSRKEYIVVSSSNGKSNIIERYSGKKIAENVSFAEATRNSELLNRGKSTLQELGYKEQKTTNKKKTSILATPQQIRKNKIEYAIKTNNYNYLPKDITDKELKEIRKRMK